MPCKKTLAYRVNCHGRMICFTAKMLILTFSFSKYLLATEIDPNDPENPCEAARATVNHSRVLQSLLFSDAARGGGNVDVLPAV